MLVKPFLQGILNDEALTRGLGDPEARILVEWLVEQVESLAKTRENREEVAEETRRLCRRGRIISRFVLLWCHENNRGAAVQLAGVERFVWPLPTGGIDPCELMQGILREEGANKPTIQAI